MYIACTITCYSMKKNKVILYSFWSGRTHGIYVRRTQCSIYICHFVWGHIWYISAAAATAAAVYCAPLCRMHLLCNGMHWQMCAQECHHSFIGIYRVQTRDCVTIRWKMHFLLVGWFGGIRERESARSQNQNPSDSACGCVRRIASILQ